MKYLKQKQIRYFLIKHSKYQLIFPIMGYSVVFENVSFFVLDELVMKK